MPLRVIGVGTKGLDPQVAAAVAGVGEMVVVRLRGRRRHDIAVGHLEEHAAGGNILGEDTRLLSGTRRVWSV